MLTLLLLLSTFNTRAAETFEATPAQSKFYASLDSLNNLRVAETGGGTDDEIIIRFGRRTISIEVSGNGVLRSNGIAGATANEVKILKIPIEFITGD